MQRPTTGTKTTSTRCRASSAAADTRDDAASDAGVKEAGSPREAASAATSASAACVTAVV
jgi:hypothetical protein